MGRKRKQVTSSKSGSSTSDTSLNTSVDAVGLTAKSAKKKQKTVRIQETAKENLSKFAFESRSRDNMATSEHKLTEQIDDSTDQVFSPVVNSSPSHGVTNEDLMLKLCANGKEISRLSQTVEELRSALFTVQTENDRLIKEVREAKEREEEIRSRLTEVKFTADLADNRVEELSAYMRRNNIRIFGVEEVAENGSRETAEECENKALSLFRDKLKLKVERNDIEAVHRLGATRRTALSGSTDVRSKQNAPRGIIVRFVSRRVRDMVLYSRKNLRGSRIVMVEDLTPRSYALLCTVRSDITVCKQAWTKNGKVVVKTLSDRIVNINKIADLNEHRRACADLLHGNSSSATGIPTGRNDRRGERNRSTPLTSSTRM